jgi:hypothetical protein
MSAASEWMFEPELNAAAFARMHALELRFGDSMVNVISGLSSNARNQTIHYL